MELVALFGIGLLLVVIGGSIAGIVAAVRANTNRRSINNLEHALKIAKERIADLEATARDLESGFKPGAEKRIAPAAEKPPAVEKPLAARKPRAAEPAPPEAEPPSEPKPAPKGELAASLARDAKERARRLVTAPPRRRPPAPAGLDKEWWQDFEKTVGKRWITWSGVIVLFLAAALFVKHAFDSGWLGPVAKIAMGVVFGTALLVAGDRFVRKGYRALGQGLLGCGLAVLYVSLFAGYKYYDLFPQAVAFGLMIVVTAAGMTLAVLHDAIAIGVIAILGGLLTPVLVSTGRDSRDALFAYLLVLDLGVLGVAFFRKWRALDGLAFVGTWVLYAGWYVQYYRAAAVVPAFAWGAGIFAVFLGLPFVYCLRRGKEVTAERFFGAVANAAVFLVFAYAMLHAKHTHLLGFTALGMSAAYIVLGTAARRRVPGDARALFGFVALAVALLTLAVPLHLKMHGIMLAWAIEAPVLLYLGYRFRYFPVRAGALAVLAIAVVRLFAYHWPLHSDLFVPVFNRHFGSAMFVPAAGFAYAVIHHRWKEKGGHRDRAMKIAAALASGLLALLILHAELRSWLVESENIYAARCVVVYVWAAGAVAYLAAGLYWREIASRVAAVVALAVAAVLAAQTYGLDLNAKYLLCVNARFLTALVVTGLIFAHSIALRRFREAGAVTEDERRFAGVLIGIGIAGLFLLLSVETYAYFIDAIADRSRAGWVALMALSIVWGLYATALLAVGFWRRVRWVRFTGLALFGLTAAKLIFVDMASVKQAYRIVAFFVLGLLMVGASYLYHRAEKLLGSPAPDASPGEGSEEKAEETGEEKPEGERS